MSDAQERIWAWEYGRSGGDPEGMGEWYTLDVGLDGDEIEYVRGDIYDDARSRSKRAEKQLSLVFARAEAAEFAVKRLREALVLCRDKIDNYIRHEYPSDHPVHERCRNRDFSANPARIALNPEGESHD